MCVYVRERESEREIFEGVRTVGEFRGEGEGACCRFCSFAAAVVVVDDDDDDAWDVGRGADDCGSFRLVSVAAALGLEIVGGGRRGVAMEGRGSEAAMEMSGGVGAHHLSASQL